MSKLNRGSVISKSVLLANLRISNQRFVTLITVATTPKATASQFVVRLSFFMSVASEDAIFAK